MIVHYKDTIDVEWAGMSFIYSTWPPSGMKTSRVISLRAGRVGFQVGRFDGELHCFFTLYRGPHSHHWRWGLLPEVVS